MHGSIKGLVASSAVVVIAMLGCSDDADTPTKKDSGVSDLITTDTTTSDTAPDLPTPDPCKKYTNWPKNASWQCSMNGGPEFTENTFYLVQQGGKCYLVGHAFTCAEPPIGPTKGEKKFSCTEPFGSVITCTTN